MIDLEIALVERFGWSLRDIDDTDVESLIPFVLRLTGKKGSTSTGKSAQVYCDQVDWL